MRSLLLVVDDGCPPGAGGQQLVAVEGHGTDRRDRCHDQVWSFRRMPAGTGDRRSMVRSDHRSGEKESDGGRARSSPTAIDDHGHDRWPPARPDRGPTAAAIAPAARRRRRPPRRPVVASSVDECGRRSTPPREPSPRRSTCSCVAADRRGPPAHRHRRRRRHVAGRRVRGLPVVTAARLQAEAAHGEILVSDVVRLLAGDRAAGAASRSGRSPPGGSGSDAMLTAAWAPPDRRRRRPTPPPPLPLALRAPGRARLRRPLRGDGRRWSERGGSPVPAGQIVLIGGEAGTGKTRLATEFGRARPPTRRRRAARQLRRRPRPPVPAVGAGRRPAAGGPPTAAMVGELARGWPR